MNEAPAAADASESPCGDSNALSDRGSALSTCRGDLRANHFGRVDDVVESLLVAEAELKGGRLQGQIVVRNG